MARPYSKDCMNGRSRGRQRINIHGAIDLETVQTRMIEALTIAAASTALPACSNAKKISALGST